MINHDKILAKAKRYYWKNREKILARDRAYYLKNRAEILTRDKISYLKNREKNHEKRLVRDRDYREKNREKEIVRHKDYRERNPEKFHDYYQKNHDRLLVLGRDYYWKNREERLTAMKIQYQKSPEKFIVKARVRREKISHISPIDIILNKKFEGSELHHTGVEMDGGFVGVYIPKTMNRNHSAQFGKERNLDKVNYDAIEFLCREIGNGR